MRCGRMTPGQKKGWTDHWSHYGLNLDMGLLNLETCFLRQAPLVLEIGYGMGHSLIDMAKQESEMNFIGIEIHRPGVGSLLHNLYKNILNVRTYCDDAVEVIKHCIPNNSLQRVQIFFPDPWHKKRHYKRRLIQAEFISLLVPKIREQGIIHVATDWEEYAEKILEVLTSTPCLINQAQNNRFILRPEYRPVTKFEKRGQRLGHIVNDLIFIKQKK